MIVESCRLTFQNVKRVSRKCKKQDIIFANGDFWHGWYYLQGEDFSHKKHFNNEYFKSRIQNDARITMQLDKLGYIILRFWEHEINKNREKCIQKIIKIIKEARKQTSTKNS